MGFESSEQEKSGFQWQEENQRSANAKDATGFQRLSNKKIILTLVSDQEDFIPDYQNRGRDQA